MNLTVVMRIALRALMRNRVRSLLTALGIIVGIAAVIAVVAVGEGATVMIRKQISAMGDNMVLIFPGSMRTGGFHGGMGTQQSLTVEDANAIVAECPHVLRVAPIVRSGGQVMYKENNWATQIQGVNSAYADIRNLETVSGAFFGESDVRAGARICVLGQTVVTNLFGFDDPLGKVIRVKKMPFRVVGVLEKKGSGAFGQDMDDLVLMPWTTVRRVIENSPFNNVSHIVASLDSMENLEQASDEISRLLRQRHRLQPQADDDFTITDMTEVTTMITQVSRMMTILLAVIASISLMVGGIGIMNIMLVSVTERTREIGLRMAVGARRRDILLQFLVEAIVLSGLGGILGAALGCTAAGIISHINGWPILISARSIAIALGFSAVVGVFFGFYPALRASRLNPIEALRYE